MTLRTLADIGRVVQHARDFDPKNWTGAMSPSASPAAPQAVEAFFGLLETRGVDYALVGGIALLYYVEGRNTQDLDLIVAVEDLTKLPEVRLIERDRYFARGEFRGLRVDFLLTAHPLFARVRREYVQPVAFLGHRVPVATPAGLILLKLYALPSLYRQGDFGRVGLYENDIAVLMYHAQPDMDALLGVLEEHVSAGEMAALREIVADLARRVARFQARRDAAAEAE